jgi:hypothetical protein
MKKLRWLMEQLWRFMSRGEMHGSRFPSRGDALEREPSQSSHDAAQGATNEWGRAITRALPETFLRRYHLQLLAQPHLFVIARMYGEVGNKLVLPTCSPARVQSDGV